MKMEKDGVRGLGFASSHISHTLIAAWFAKVHFAQIHGWSPQNQSATSPTTLVQGVAVVVITPNNPYKPTNPNNPYNPYNPNTYPEAVLLKFA